jgi:hypothetical protein
MLVVLKIVRIAFPEIYVAKPFGGTGASRCSAMFLMDPATPHGAANISQMQKAIVQVATDKWKDKARDMVRSFAAKAELCLHEGNEKSEYEGFAGMKFVSASNDQPPVVVDENKRILTPQNHQNKIYSGCYVNAQVDVWAQDNQYGKKINAKLIAVQYQGQGVAFSGGAGYDDSLFTAADPSAGATGSDFFGQGGGDPFAGLSSQPANNSMAGMFGGNADPFASPAPAVSADSFFGAPASTNPGNMPW